MWINRLKVTGDKGFDYSFDKTNILLGTNESGKTTFVNIILYALGAKIGSFIDEISKFELCDYVHIDIVTKLNNRHEIVRKLPRADHITVIPFDDDESLRTEDVQIFNLDEYSDFLLSEEKYPKNIITYSATNTATITYRFLLRAALVDQFTPPHKILANVLGDRNDFMNNQELLSTAIIEEILDTLNQDLHRLRLELKQKDKDRTEINNRISFFSDMQKETNIGNEVVYRKIEKVDEDLEKLENKRTELHNFRYEQLNKLEKTNDKEIVDEIVKLRRKVSILKSSLMQTTLEAKDLKNMLPVFKAELEQLKKQLASQKILFNIPVTICPICFTTIGEIETVGLCSHCGENSHQEVFDSAAAYKRTIEDTIKELNILITQKKQEERAQNVNLVATKNQLTKVESSYFNGLKNIKQPIEHMIDEIEKRLEYITEHSYRLKEIRRILIQLNLLKSQKDELGRAIEGLRIEIEEEEKKSSRNVIKIDKFEETYKMLFELIYGVEHDISINTDNYMPIIDGSPVLNNSNHSASIKVVSRLAYIFTLFLLNRYLEKAKINNMKFIIFDSPRDKELDIDKYERFLELIRSQDEGQVFLTGSLKEIDVFYKIFPEKEGCYIDRLTDESKLLKTLGKPIVKI